MKGASDAAVLADALSLVMSPSPTVRTVARWTIEQRREAWRWVGREILSANDNPVRRLSFPDFLARWMLQRERRG